MDGGGIRGYYTAQLLAGLLTSYEKQRGVTLDLGRGFDLIAGTSTGGILAAGLAIGKSPTDIAQLYRARGPTIFPERFPSLGANLRSALWVIRHWERPSASQIELRNGLAEIFRDMTLADVWHQRRIALTIPAVSIENYGPKVFKTPHDSSFTHDPGLPLVDVLLATSAAPLYFPLHPIGPEQGYFRNDLFVDGGLWANNPALVGLIEAIDILSTRGTPGHPIEVFSLGTCAGKVDQSRLMADPSGGIKTWNAGKDVIDLTLTTSANAMEVMAGLLANSLSRQGIPIRYARLPDPEMTSHQHASLGMDKADERAFSTMDSLAATNQVRILSGTKNHPDYAAFGEILHNLPERVDQSIDHTNES
jgi:hypothetical protein